jgi:N-succinyldiaminopimelate aminotransferase
VPVSAVTHDGSAAARALRTAVRFTFVKQEDVLRAAVTRLAALGTPPR